MNRVTVDDEMMVLTLRNALRESADFYRTVSATVDNGQLSRLLAERAKARLTLADQLEAELDDSDLDAIDPMLERCCPQRDFSDDGAASKCGDHRPLLERLADCDRVIAAKIASLGDSAVLSSGVRYALTETEQALRDGESQLARIVNQATGA